MWNVNLMGINELQLHIIMWFTLTKITLNFKKANIKVCILHDFIYMKLKSRQTLRCQKLW